MKISKKQISFQLIHSIHFSTNEGEFKPSELQKFEARWDPSGRGVSGLVWGWGKASDRPFIRQSVYFPNLLQKTGIITKSENALTTFNFS